MNCITENLTGYITKESCNYVVKGDCISGIGFIIFVLFFLIMGLVLGWAIFYKKKIKREKGSMIIELKKN